MTRTAPRPPEAPVAAYDAGLALLAQGRRGEASESFKSVLLAKPDHAPSMLQLAKLFEASGQLDHAENFYRRAAAIEPLHPQTIVDAGIFLFKIGKKNDGEAFVRLAAKTDPAFFHASNTLGTMLRKQGRYEEALACYTHVLEAAPQRTETHLYLSMLYEVWGKPDLALAHYKKWQPAEGDGFKRRLNAAAVLFRMGFLADGWREYGHRHKRMNNGKGRAFPQAPWTGQLLAGKTILLSHEQGLGEQIMFGGMIPEIINQAKKVIAEVEPRLAALFTRSFPALHVIPYQEPPHRDTAAQDIDYYCALGDLGQHVRKSFDAFPRHSGYLVTDAARVADIKRRYTALAQGRKVIGISWFSKNMFSGSNKSMALNMWAPILTAPGVFFVNLQYGPEAEEAADVAKTLGVDIYRDTTIDPGGDFDPFAAHVAALDQVISVSNTTVHMAGALNVPTRLLLPTNEAQFWHWFSGREPCRWYPSVRFYVQTKVGDWQPVIDRVAAELRAES